MNATSKSEVAAIRILIQEEYESAQRGLSGIASGTSRHDFISSKTENLGKLHDRLTALIGPDDAIALLANTIWTLPDQGIAPR